MTYFITPLVFKKEWSLDVLDDKHEIVYMKNKTLAYSTASNPSINMSAKYTAPRWAIMHYIRL